MNTKEKSLYRDVLEKQLAFLEEAQKDAAENYKFTVITYYTKDILNLAKEIDKLDSQHDDSEKSEEFPLDSFSTAELLSELKNRKAIHVEYELLDEESFIFGKYDGKIY